MYGFCQYFPTSDVQKEKGLTGYFLRVHRLTNIFNKTRQVLCEIHGVHDRSSHTAVERSTASNPDIVRTPPSGSVISDQTATQFLQPSRERDHKGLLTRASVDQSRTHRRLPSTRLRSFYQLTDDLLRDGSLRRKASPRPALRPRFDCGPYGYRRGHLLSGFTVPPPVQTSPGFGQRSCRLAGQVFALDQMSGLAQGIQSLGARCRPCDRIPWKVAG